jgi:hypothetical protein
MKHKFKVVDFGAKSLLNVGSGRTRNKNHPFIYGKGTCFARYDEIIIENINDALEIKLKWKGNVICKASVADISLNFKFGDILCIDGIEGKIEINLDAY